jgi:uncharacterized YigZ family protein
MNYKTVLNEALGEFEEKKSVFIGAVKRVNSEEEAKEFIFNIKSSHKEARHNVYAYVIGSNYGVQRYSDDGEPQGTGGIPVLEVIKKNEISDTVIVVTRYFGGVLLGASGLCRAYGKAASLAVKNAGIVEKVQGCEILITIDYDLLGKVQYLFSQNNWNINSTDFTDKVSLKMYSEIANVNNIEKALLELTSNRYVMKKGKEEMFFKQSYTLIRLD